MRRAARAALAIAACALTVAPGATRAHPPRGSETVVLRSGAGLVAVTASLDVQLAREPDGVQSEHGVPSEPDGVQSAGPVRLAWQKEGGALVAHASTPSWTALAKITPGTPATIEVAIRYHIDADVVREALVLDLPGAPRAIGRDLSFAPLAGSLRIDRGTPILVESAADRGGIVISPRHGIAAARVVPSDTKTSTALTLILDDEDAHPFEVYETCHTSWTIGSEEAPRARKARTSRRSGDTVGAAAALYVMDGERRFTPLVVERWPAAASAALVFTDHADRTDPDGLRAILYGTSDRSAATYGKGGFLGHGLKLTKTLFESSGTGTLGSKPIRRLADEIVKAGGEIGSHSITEGRDGRDRVARKLGRFAPWNVVTWIDHQPQTNCEAVTAQGWNDGGKFGIRDLLVKAGIRWIWAAQDAGPKNSLWNLFDPSHPDAAAPAIFPMPIDPRLWMFRSSWFYEDADTLAAALADTELDRLERERGLFVAHTYLSPTKNTTRRSELRRRALVDVRKGVASLHPSFDAALGRIAERVKRGTSVSLTWREAGDRLRALGDVVVRYEPNGRAIVENTGNDTIQDLTISVHGSNDLGIELSISGATVDGTSHGSDRASIWFDLPPGGAVTVGANMKTGSLPFSTGGAVTAEVGR